MNFDIKYVKIFVTIPKGHVEKVRNAIFSGKFGIIGNYNCCTYSVQGKGTFKPTENAHPFIGEPNNLEIVDEVKLEFLCKTSEVKRAIELIRSVHPYEEPAIDIVPLYRDFFKKLKNSTKKVDKITLNYHFLNFIKNNFNLY